MNGSFCLNHLEGVPIFRRIVALNENMEHADIQGTWTGVFKWKIYMESQNES